MTDNSPHVDDAQLDLLLFGDETSEIYQASWAHTESCAPCRTRLEFRSGAEEFDQITRHMLAHEIEGSETDDRSNTSEGTRPQFSFLDPSHHPEMLGRLGRYDIERLISRGGMGIVLKGFDTELNRPVAIKVLSPHLAHVGVARQRFAREAQAAAAIVHEHVVAIHNVETEGELPFLVMPYIDGESLQERADRQGALGVKEVLRIGLQVAAGLQAAHEQGVVHRDVKPGNILLERGVERTLVTDFGLAQTMDDATLTHTGIVTGTPNYMSPEQATGKPVDARSDLFSLGSVLYFMATGRPPFIADKAMGILHRLCHETPTPVWQLRPEIPDPLSDLIDRLLEKNPAHRYSSADQVHHELQHILATLQNPAPRHFVALKRLVRRNYQTLHRTAQIAGVAILLGALVWLVQRRDGASPTSPSTTPFSATVWYQASPQEADDWANTVGELQQQLTQLQQRDARTAHFGEQALSATEDWDHAVDHLQQQLTRLEQREASTMHFEKPILPAVPQQQNLHTISPD